MKYNMNVIIKDPNTEAGMNSDLWLKLEAVFWHDPEQYGNGYQVSIGSRKDSKIPLYSSVYDLRYNKDFDPEHKMSWLVEWAENYWNGFNGAYKLSSISLEQKGE